MGHSLKSYSQEGEVREQACPSCGRDDQLANVSSIWMAGTSRADYGGNGYSLGFAGNQRVVLANQNQYSGIQQTALAKLLSPPPKPQTKDVSGQVVFALILLGLGAFGAWVGLTSGDPSYGWATGVGGLMVLIGFFALLCACGDHDKSVKERDAAMPRWDRAFRVWSNIDYCARCNFMSMPSLPYTYPVDTSLISLTFMADQYDEFYRQLEERQQRREACKRVALKMRDVVLAKLKTGK
jgi:hypothetical protein